MNGKVRSMNLQLDQALRRHDLSHIGIIDAASIARKDFTTHGLHLNSRGKERHTHLIAERVTGGHVSSLSFFSLNLIAHRCLTYIKCGSTVSEAHKRTSE
jgi:hypothetical protein